MQADVLRLFKEGRKPFRQWFMNRMQMLQMQRKGIIIWVCMKALLQSEFFAASVCFSAWPNCRHRFHQSTEHCTPTGHLLCGQLQLPLWVSFDKTLNFKRKESANWNFVRRSVVLIRLSVISIIIIPSTGRRRPPPHVLFTSICPSHYH